MASQTESQKTPSQEANGRSDAPSSPADSTPPTMQRAEEMVDRMGEQIGRWATQLGHQVLKLAARAREEAEDIWAEAQNIRRGDQ